MKLSFKLGARLSAPKLLGKYWSNRVGEDGSRPSLKDHTSSVNNAIPNSRPEACTRGQYAPPGIYLVTAKLPERSGEFEYHIKHTSELHERIAKESELHEARR